MFYGVAKYLIIAMFMGAPNQIVRVIRNIRMNPFNRSERIVEWHQPRDGVQIQRSGVFRQSEPGNHNLLYLLVRTSRLQQQCSSHGNL